GDAGGAEHQRVGELQFSIEARPGVLDARKYLRREYVASENTVTRSGRAGLWTLHQGTHCQSSPAAAGVAHGQNVEHAETVDLRRLYDLRSDNAAWMLGVAIHQLSQTGRRGIDQGIGKNNREGLVANQRACGSNGVRQAEQLLLPYRADLHQLREAAHRFDVVI